MAKQTTIAAKNTADLFTQKLPRGRPPKAGSMTAAERQAKFRAQRVMVDLGPCMTDTVRKYSADFDLTIDDVIKELVRFALTNRNWSQTGF